MVIGILNIDLFIQKYIFILILQMFLNKINARKLRYFLKGNNI